MLLLNTLLVEVVGLGSMKELYPEDVNFGEAWTPWSVDRTMFLDYQIQEQISFKNQLCIPQGEVESY